MNNIYRILYLFFTEPLGLPINPLLSWFIMLAVGEIAYRIAYYAVGRLGFRGDTGSRIHWEIRLFCYVVIWAIIRLFILAVKNWQLTLMIAIGICAAVLLCVIVISIMRRIKKRRAVKDNA